VKASSSFPSKPQQAKGAIKITHQNLIANQYQLRFKKETEIHMYAIITEPSLKREAEKADLVREIIQQIDKEKNVLTNALKDYLIAGFIVYSQNYAEESKLGESYIDMGKNRYRITFQHVKSFDLSMIKDGYKKEIMSFINSTCKKALRKCEMKQLGRLPNYFNKKDTVVLDDFGIEVWRGFDVTTRFC
jgi:hypothetical protein